MFTLCVLSVFLVSISMIIEIKKDKNGLLTVIITITCLTLLFFSANYSVPEEYKPVSAKTSSHFYVTGKEIYQKDDKYYIADTNNRFWNPFVGPKMIEIKPEKKFVCQNCGSFLSSDTRYCPKCGTNTKQYCTFCNNEIDKNDKYCSKCGNKLS